MKYTYLDLLEGLDCIFADYGGNEIMFPEEIENKYGEYLDIDILTEEEAKEVFEYNGGDVESTIEYLEGDE